MVTMNSPTTTLAAGLAALGAGLIVAGIRFSRRRKSATRFPVDALASGAGSPTGKRDATDVQDDREQPDAIARQWKPLLEYFFWVTALALPFWLFGGDKLPLPINLPTGALVTFVPTIAAAITSYRYGGVKAVQALLRRAADYQKVRDRKWYLPALLLMPIIAVLSYALMRLTGRSLPAQVELSLLMGLTFLALFLISDIGEELGWTGFALEPLQQRWGALRASLLLGVIWVVWHIIPWIQTGNPASWIFWQGLFSVAQRVLIVWVYNGSGRSVFAATLVHVTANLGWALFPNASSHYDPLVTAAVTWLAVLAILFVWEPATPSRLRRGYVRSR